MIQSAIIGLIVALIMMLVKKNKEKKALAGINNSEMLDTPEYSAYFHHATETIFNGKGFKFFDNTGVLYVNGKVVNYKADKSSDPIAFDLDSCSIEYAGLKKKMKWISIDLNGTKHYFTTFKQGGFSLDRSEMDRFIEKLKELSPDSNLDSI